MYIALKGGTKKMIILNQIQCNTCKEIITSRYTHHFVCCKCESESTMVCVDGGFEYLRRVGINYTELSVSDLDPFELIRNSLVGLKKGMMGNEPDRYVLLKDMSNNHLINVIKFYGSNPKSPYIKYYKEELKYREENKIIIYD